MIRISSLLITAVLLCWLAAPARAHPVSLTKAFVYVTRDKINAKLEVFMEDLLLFHNLQANEQDFLDPDVIEEGIKKHEQFLRERFVIRDLAGQPLEGRIVDIVRPSISAEGVPLAELMAHKLVFQLQYELLQEPEFLTFSQRFTDEEILIRAEMQLDVKQENGGSPTLETLRPDQPFTVRLSWTNPPLSAEASEKEQEEWTSKQQEETLGITSYSSVYSFLYIEDFEVRHEILIPLLTLEESILVARDEDEYLDLAEQEAARRQIEAYFTTGNPIEIDGVEVKPVVQRCDFYGLDFKDFARRAEPQPVSLVNARVGIILSYRTKVPPSSVKVTWNRFNNYIWAVEMVVFAYADASRVTLSRLGGNATYLWRNPSRRMLPPLHEVNVQLPDPPRLSIPVISALLLAILPVALLLLWVRGAGSRSYGFAAGILLLGAAAAWPWARWEARNPLAARPAMAAEQANVIFGSLHQNAFQAFAYRDEDEIYDALAKSVDGDLLNELYLQIRRGLEMAEQGGAVSRIREVKIVEGQSSPLSAGESQDSPGFRYQCRWTINGTVEHWGHVHARTNQYEAIWTVQARDHHWKITDIELLDEKHLKIETSLRGI